MAKNTEPNNGDCVIWISQFGTEIPNNRHTHSLRSYYGTFISSSDNGQR